MIHLHGDVTMAVSSHRLSFGCDKNMGSVDQTQSVMRHVQALLRA
jgi:hypothetical protein